MKEALKLALEALNWSTPHEGAVITHGEAIAAIKEALAQPAQKDCGCAECGKKEKDGWYLYCVDCMDKTALAQPEQCQCPNCKVTLHASDCAVHNEPAYPKRACNCGARQEQEPVAWKLVPRDPTDEMLKAMDECSTEGYDERLYAGHAASVYMAAVDVAPAPPQRNPLTHEQRFDLLTKFEPHKNKWKAPAILIDMVEAAHGIKEKNNG